MCAAVRRLPPQGLLFDIGGGNGHVARALTDAGFPTGVVEPGATGADNAYDRGIRPVIRATTRTARFRPGVLPAVGTFDVIEHVEADGDFLAEIHRLMAVGGRLYLTVPAYRWLWSVDDVRAGHHHRYTMRRLRSMVGAAGFEVEYATYLFRFLMLPVLALRTIPSRLGLRRTATDATGDHRMPGGVAGRVLGWLMRREYAIVAGGRRMRFGSSILLVARRMGPADDQSMRSRTT